MLPGRAMVRRQLPAVCMTRMNTLLCRCFTCLRLGWGSQPWSTSVCWLMLQNAVAMSDGTST